MSEQFPVPPFTAEQRQQAARPTQVPGPGEVPLGRSAHLATLQIKLAGLGPVARRRAVTQFWAEVAVTGTPLVEGEQVTFLWRADPGADAAGVLLVANKRYDRFRPHDTVLRQLLDTDIWYLTLVLPGDWVGSYQFLPLTKADLPEASALRPNFASAQPDPLSRTTLQVPGEALRSVLNLSANFPPVPGPGPVSVLEAPQQSAELSYQVSRAPAAQTGEPGPVVVVLDGELWLQGLAGPQLLAEAARSGVLPGLDALWVSPAATNGKKGDWVYLTPYYNKSPRHPWGWFQLGSNKQVTVDLKAAGLPTGNTKLAVLSGNFGQFGRTLGWTILKVPYFSKYTQIIPSPDLTGDGYGDVLSVDDDGVLWLHAGSATGTLAQPTKLGAGWGGLTISAPGDFNRDGNADILAKAANGDLFFYPGNGKGGLGKSTKAGWNWGPYDIIPAGDVTGDGIADVLALDGDGVLYYYAGNGKGGFTGKLTRNGQGWTNVDLYPAGDLNGDGNADIVSIRKDGTLHTHLGRGDGGFSKSTQSGQGWSGYELFAGSDGNGDGLADLYSRNTKGELFFYAGKTGGFRATVNVGSNW